MSSFKLLASDHCDIHARQQHFANAGCGVGANAVGIGPGRGTLVTASGEVWSAL